MSPSAFLQLPLHAVSLILTRLDDVPTLGSAILAHPLLYAAYKDAANTILRCILQNQIPQDAMPFALMAYQAREMDHRNAQEIHNLVKWVRDPGALLYKRNFYIKQFRTVLDPAHDIRPDVAAALSRTHTLVHYFGDDFIKNVLPHATVSFGAGIPRSSVAEVSHWESFRVQKALYRFQTYCNLRYRDETDMDTTTWDAYRLAALPHTLRVFSPWVNEQLACIYDYLEELLSETFNDVAAHDVEWGAQRVDWVSKGRNNTHKQAYLLYGLPFLYELTRTASFQQRQRLLKEKGLPATDMGLPFHFDRLYADIIRSDPPGSRILADRHHWTKDAMREHFLGGCGDEVDSIGTEPFAIWHYAHRNRSAERFVHLRENCLLRRYGYVMWDPPLAEDATVSRADVRARVRELQRQGRDHVRELETQREGMQASWDARVRILEDGGRGYWLEGDSSQIIWPEPHKLPAKDV